jgi:Fe2+ or Zn2+ uptake regulation protein
MSDEFRHTEKQTEIMTIVLNSASAGAFCTLQELRDKLSYGKDVSKQAVLCSLKFLAKHGMLERRHRGPKSMELIPTQQGYKVFRVDHD